jgi:hypothetical protein
MRGRVIVASYSKTAGGANVGNGWIQELHHPADHTELGRLLRSALNASREDAPWPDFRSGLTAEQQRFLEVAGVKTFNQYMRGAREVYVHLNDPEPGLELRPSRNEGRNGFVKMNEQSIFLDAGVDNQELGSAVRRAIDLSH